MRHSVHIHPTAGEIRNGTHIGVGICNDGALVIEVATAIHIGAHRNGVLAGSHVADGTFITSGSEAGHTKRLE